MMKAFCEIVSVFLFVGCVGGTFKLVDAGSSCLDVASLVEEIVDEASDLVHEIASGARLRAASAGNQQPEQGCVAAGQPIIESEETSPFVISEYYHDTVDLILENSDCADRPMMDENCPVLDMLASVAITELKSLRKLYGKNDNDDARLFRRRVESGDSSKKTGKTTRQLHPKSSKSAKRSKSSKSESPTSSPVAAPDTTGVSSTGGGALDDVTAIPDGIPFRTRVRKLSLSLQALSYEGFDIEPASGGPIRIVYSISDFYIEKLAEISGCTFEWRRDEKEEEDIENEDEKDVMINQEEW